MDIKDFLFSKYNEKLHIVYKIFGIKIKLRKDIKKDQTLDTPKLYPILLTDNEKQFLINTISSGKNYLEFGSGGSTFLSLLETKANAITSVESDNDWLEYIKKWHLISTSISQKRLTFKYINIGKTGIVGKPINEDNKNMWPSYSKQVFEEQNDFDVVFIDGRFRVACALQTILNCKKDVKILMHDYPIRPYYHCILEFLDIVDVIDTMCLFKIKENIDMNAVQKMWEEYKYIYE